MNKNQSAIRIYPMKKRFQYVNKIVGRWMYSFGTMLFVERSLITLIPWNFLRIFFLWGIGSLEWYFALQKMREGGARSYLQISEDGLAYCNYPFVEIRCKWEDVKSIKKGGALAMFCA